ncbi:MAG: hypothetical protein U5Q16_07425 [Gammaproteobacteria bacterium]|nr:hypothetical protein [Gammaproteobacteria bacterium]
MLILLAGCGTSSDNGSQTPAPNGAGDAEPPPSGEILLAEPPQGWVETGAMQTPVLRMAEYGPPDEPEGRVERITFEAQEGKPLPDPIEFVQAVSRDLEASCKGFEGINISSGFENGYPTSVRLMICPELESSPHGQVVMAKAIQGNDEFYVITRRLRVPPMRGDGQPLTAQEMAEWTAHLKGIRLCDTRSDEFPCPESVAPPDTTIPAATPG